VRSIQRGAEVTDRSYKIKIKQSYALSDVSSTYIYGTCESKNEWQRLCTLGIMRAPAVRQNFVQHEYRELFCVRGGLQAFPANFWINPAVYLPCE
jgi:hypothetical protein